MAKHTPGPWRMKEYEMQGDTYWAIWDADDVPIITTISEPGIARLIAAAPELLEAVNALLGCESERQEEKTDVQKAPPRDKYMAAVEKAKTAKKKMEGE